MPQVCALDPDGDMVRRLRSAGRAQRDPAWPCYHTDLYRVTEGGIELGMVGCAVGAPFAVLVAEQLFASGCRLLISMTSAGRLAELRDPPYFILIEKALRDEGASYHYLPPCEFSYADPALLAAMRGAFDGLRVPMERGATWTTDAPFRETGEAIAAKEADGLLAVEMEAAALYAFATARRKPVLCFAHVTNQMALVEGDFEKGEADGTIDALAVIVAAARSWVARGPEGKERSEFDLQSHWENVYRTKGERDVSWFEESPAISLDLIHAAGIKADASIIDIGGGASRLVDVLLDEGFEAITVLDLSNEALAQSKATLGARSAKVRWVVADVTTWEPSQSYDMWHDRATFHFLTDANDRAAYGERVLRAVRPGGHVIIGTFAFDGPERCSGLPVVRHDAASLGQMLGPSFELIESRNHVHQTPTGGAQLFQFSRFRATFPVWI